MLISLIEDQIGKYEEKIEKEVAKAAKKFGESFDEAKFRETNPRVLEIRRSVTTFMHAIPRLCKDQTWRL